MKHLEANTPKDKMRYYANERMFLLQSATYLGTIDDMSVKRELKRLEKLAKEVK